MNPSGWWRQIERNALRAQLDLGAEDWRWSSMWRHVHGTAEEGSLLATSPIERPPDWVERVNRTDGESELESLRQSLHRVAPLWSAGVAKADRETIGPRVAYRPNGRLPRWFVSNPVRRPARKPTTRLTSQDLSCILPFWQVIVSGFGGLRPLLLGVTRQPIYPIPDLPRFSLPDLTLFYSTGPVPLFHPAQPGDHTNSPCRHPVTMRRPGGGTNPFAATGNRPGYTRRGRPGTPAGAREHPSTHMPGRSGTYWSWDRSTRTRFKCGSVRRISQPTLISDGSIAMHPPTAPAAPPPLRGPSASVPP